MIETIILILIFTIPAFVVIFKSYMWDLYYWQLKEYRWDRFWAHIRWDNDEEHRNYLLVGIKFILFCLVSLIFTLPFLAILGIFLTYSIWIFELFDFGKDLIGNNIRKPALKNVRNILVLLMLGAVTALVFFIVSFPFILLKRADGVPSSFTINWNTPAISYPDIYILLGIITLIALFINLASPVIVPIFVFVTSPIAYLKRQLVILKAKQKLKTLDKDFVLIGITGSQGKTTTKEILYELLKNKFKVAKTPENYNTDIGIAKSILSELKKDTQIFIAEMGAYKKGEIKNIVSNFRPNIGIITDIDTQHIGIFGSQKSLMEAKGEIVQYLPANGVAILNADNKYCMQLVSKLNSKKVLCGTNKNILKKDLVTPETSINLLAKTSENTKGIKLSVSSNFDTPATFEFPFTESHLVSNLLICISACKELGMINSEIQEYAKSVSTKLPRLSVDTGDNGTVIINNSYSSSKKGFISAVEYMNKIKGQHKLNRRIVITRGILELGKHKSRVYKNLLKEIKKSIDILITTDPLLYNLARINNINLEIHYIKNSDEIIYLFRKITSPKDVVLLEGRLSPKVMKAVISDLH